MKCSVTPQQLVIYNQWEAYVQYHVVIYSQTQQYTYQVVLLLGL